MKNKINQFSFLFLCFSFLIISCATFDPKDPYPNMSVLHYGNTIGYEFANAASDKLIIIIEGSDWTSVLGYHNTKKWKWVDIGAQILQVLGDTHTIFIPEKFDWQVGVNYENDLNARAIYIAENLIECYTTNINAYLAEHTYSSTVLVGTSEGALLLPLLYEKIVAKENITGMVAAIYGGLSIYEIFEVWSDSPDISKNWRETYREKIKIYSSADITTYPNSIEENFWGMPLKWLSSFIHIRPFDYYKNIQIPVLFIHGEKDYRVPIESTRYVQENLPDKPFEYLYYPKMKHGPSNYKEIIQLRNDIAAWILKKGL